MAVACATGVAAASGEAGAGRGPHCCAAKPARSPRRDSQCRRCCDHTAADADGDADEDNDGALGDKTTLPASFSALCELSSHPVYASKSTAARDIIFCPWPARLRPLGGFAVPRPTQAWSTSWRHLATLLNDVLRPNPCQRCPRQPAGELTSQNPLPGPFGAVFRVGFGSPACTSIYSSPSRRHGGFLGAAKVAGLRWCAGYPAKQERRCLAAQLALQPAGNVVWP